VSRKSAPARYAGKRYFSAHGGEVGRKRSESQKSRGAARKEWEEANPGCLEEEKERFIRDIQPLLQAFSVREIVKACKCSPCYASLMKNGKYVPPPAFYKDLEKLIIQNAW